MSEHDNGNPAVIAEINKNLGGFNMEVLWMVYGVIDSEPCVMVFDHECDALAFMTETLDCRGGECAATRLRCSTVSGVEFDGFRMAPAMKAGWVRALVEA